MGASTFAIDSFIFTFDSRGKLRVEQRICELLMAELCVNMVEPAHQFVDQLTVVRIDYIDTDLGAHHGFDVVEAHMRSMGQATPDAAFAVSIADCNVFL